MKDRAHVDFETFCAAGSPKTLGAQRYARDPSTEAICLGWAVGDEDPELWVPGDPSPARLFDHIAAGGTVHAWNAGFEDAIWNETCRRLYGWPEVPLEAWRDTQADAAAFALPLALEAAGPALGLQLAHLKDKRGKHLINKLTKPRKPSKHNPVTRWTPENAPEDFADFYAYCRQDVEAERAIFHALPWGLNPVELETWRMTLRLNRLGWTVDLDTARRMIEVLEAHKARTLAEVADLTGGYVTTGGQVDRIRTWLATEHLVVLRDLRADTVKETLATDTDLPADARRVLEIRQELAKSSVKKFHAMEERVCEDGRVKDNLVCMGAANTGRDAGRGLQVQNFPRAAVAPDEAGIEVAVRALHTPEPLETIETLWGSPPHFASGMLRPCLTAAPGTELFCADFSSVENRMTVWLAQDVYGMGVFARGRDQYRQFIEDSRGIPYDEVTPGQRQDAKPIILGCCFQMGAKTFKATQESNGVPCSLAEAEAAVKTYRELHPGVVALWAGLNNAAIRCVQTGAPTRYHLIRFRLEPRADFLLMELPSGRELAYHRPKVQMVKMPWGDHRAAVTCFRTFKGKIRLRTTMSPGLWTENAVQATARDLLMASAKKAERAGYTPVGRVHDELVNERRKGEGSLEEFLGAMLTMPGWYRRPAHGLKAVKMEAEGWRGHRYRK